MNGRALNERAVKLHHPESAAPEESSETMNAISSKNRPLRGDSTVHSAFFKFPMMHDVLYVICAINPKLILLFNIFTFVQQQSYLITIPSITIITAIVIIILIIILTTTMEKLKQ